MNSSETLTVVGTNVAAVSILVVYHLFALQSWVQRVEAESEHAANISLSTNPGDLEREDCVRRLIRFRKAFPWLQVGLLGASVLILAAVSFWACLAASVTPLWTAMSALAVLQVVYLASTVAGLFRGLQSAAEGLHYLGIR